MYISPCGRVLSLRKGEKRYDSISLDATLFDTAASLRGLDHAVRCTVSLTLAMHSWVIYYSADYC